MLFRFLFMRFYWLVAYVIFFAYFCLWSAFLALLIIKLFDMSKNMLGKREAFALEYVLNKFNGAKAAVAAGYSVKCAESQASRLLRDVNIKERIEQIKAETSTAKRRNLDDLVSELENIAFSDITDVFKDNDWTKVKNPSELPKHLRVCISDVKIITSAGGLNTEVFVKFYNKIEAMKMLAPYLVANKPKERIDINIQFEKTAKEELN